MNIPNDRPIERFMYQIVEFKNEFLENLSKYNIEYKILKENSCIIVVPINFPKPLKRGTYHVKNINENEFLNIGNEFLKKDSFFDVKYRFIKDWHFSESIKEKINDLKSSEEVLSFIQSNDFKIKGIEINYGNNFVHISKNGRIISTKNLFVCDFKNVLNTLK